MEVRLLLGFLISVYIMWLRKIMVDIMVVFMNIIKWKMFWRKFYDFILWVVENEVDLFDSDFDLGFEMIKLYYWRKLIVIVVKVRVSDYWCIVYVFLELIY